MITFWNVSGSDQRFLAMFNAALPPLPWGGHCACAGCIPRTNASKNNDEMRASSRFREKHCRSKKKRKLLSPACCAFFSLLFRGYQYDLHCCVNPVSDELSERL